MNSRHLGGGSCSPVLWESQPVDSDVVAQKCLGALTGAVLLVAESP